MFQSFFYQICLFIFTAFFGISASADSLPTNPNDIVLVYRSHNTENAPALLTIYANGRAVVNSPAGLEKIIESYLTRQQLETLLHQLIDDYGFYDIDVKDIQQKIADTEQNENGRLLGVVIRDSNDISISLTTQERQKTQRFYGLSYIAKDYPNINTLRNLVAIEMRLKKMRHWLAIGKEEGLNKELNIANQYLQKEYPNVAPLTENDLEMVSLNLNGERNIHFQRQQLDKNQKITGYVSVYSHYDKEGIIKVTVTVHQN